MTALQDIIHRQIEQFGPISVAEYMTLCLLHPEHGYYTTRDPLGARGDFTTAPEISQMFGEMLGLCLAQSWLDQGRPAPFILAELGPGRGTLMADILRVGATVPGFINAAEVWLVEASPTLRNVQASTLREYTPNWAAQITDLPGHPLFLIANEFFDALPVRQFIRAEGGWQEQMIGLANGKLTFGLTSPLPVEALEDQREATPIGSIVETCAPATGIASEVARRIAKHGGVALIVDYGDWGSTGDTFQAVQAHKKINPLEAPGQSDLTAHVDFKALARAADGVTVTKPTPQGVLLERLGITERANALGAGLEGAALEAHISAHRRLTHPDEMGSLFKAIAFHAKGTPAPAGFDV